MGLTVVGCGGSAPTGAQSPTSKTADVGSVAPAKAPPPIQTCPSEPRDVEPVAAAPRPLPLDAFQKLSTVKGVPAAPASCAALANQRESTPESKDDPTARAQRAELAPPECADVIAASWFAGKKEITGTKAAHALVGLSVAAKLARLPTNPPTIPAEKDKAKVLEFVRGPVAAWSLGQATAIESIETIAAGLNGYGRAIAALESGAAELRFVDKLRSSPIPAGWDAELKAVYESMLDEALEKRKTRGRDAVLVGLGEAARAGLLHDARVDRARAILAKLYGGSRVDALEGLLLPPEPDHGSDPALQKLPVVWIDNRAPGDLGPALSRGVPEALRVAFRNDAGPAALKPAYARARLEMGKLYWRRVDFVEACRAADDAFLRALLVTLSRGAARDANDVVKAASPAFLNLSHTDALDAYDGPMKGYAEYDAALLRSISPPDGAAATPYLRDVAKRFRAAKLTDPAQKKKAEDRAADIEASVNAIK